MLSAAYFGWLALAMVVFLAGSSALRGYVETNALWMILLGLLLYTAGNLLMVRIMRESGMAVAISISAVLQLVLANAVAVWGFGERPTFRQGLGIGLGIVAIALIVLPSAAREGSGP